MFSFQPATVTNFLQENKKGAPGFEPRTSRSAVECSTTELYPLMSIRVEFNGIKASLKKCKGVDVASLVHCAFIVSPAK
jgi:hypothetical protein